MARRHTRREQLTDGEIETIVLAAIEFRKAMQACHPHLKPFNETYQVLHEHRVQLDAMLEKITGRKIDYRGLNLGLLPG